MQSLSMNRIGTEEIFGRAANIFCKFYVKVRFFEELFVPRETSKSGCNWIRSFRRKNIFSSALTPGDK